MSEAVRAEQVSLQRGRGAGRAVVVSDLGMSAEYGRITALMGPSGSGKTSTLRAIIGGGHVKEGVLTTLGWDVEKLSRRRVAALRRRVGVVPQNPALGSRRSVREALGEALYATGSGGRTAEARMLEALELTGTTHTTSRDVDDLSAGEARRVGMARALVVRPDLLLLDEPTANLDADAAGKVAAIISAAAAAGLAVLVATHDRDLAGIADATFTLPRPRT